jgi:hypothetical protein
MLPPDTVELVWTAPAECPSHDTVLEDAERVLAKSPQPRAHARARAVVTRDEQGRWHATLSVDADGAHSERDLDAENCQAIATATALIVAVAIEGRESDPEQAPLVQAALARRMPGPGGLASRSQLVVSVAGVVDGGLLPAPAPGGEIALGWAYRTAPFRVRVTAGATLLGAQRAALSAPAQEGGRFAAIAASVRGCASVVKDALDVGACLGLEMDRAWAEGFGPSEASFAPLTPTGTWASPLGSAFASYTLSGDVSVFLRADAVLPLASPTFGIVDSSGTDIPLHHASAGLRASLGVEARFF